MPQWLQKQLMDAFFNKNVRRIKLLNDTWLFYRRGPEKNGEEQFEEEAPAQVETTTVGSRPKNSSWFVGD